MTVSAAPGERASAQRAASPMQRAKNQLADMLARPLVDYYMIVSAVVLLTAMGLATVASATMPVGTSGLLSPGLKQALFLALGYVGFWCALKIPLRRVRQLTPLIGVIALILLLVTLAVGVGHEEVGSKSWLQVQGVGLQPSEIAKVAIAMWGAHYLAERTLPEMPRTMRSFAYFAAVAATAAAMIYAQGDVGMMLMFGITVAAIMLLAGLPLRYFGAIILVGALGLVALLMQGGFRSDRIVIFFEAFRGKFADTQNRGLQSYQALLSLAEGGVTGVGPGQSRAKWHYLPEAQNDFVFSIIGEEYGMLGALFVIGLYLILLLFGLRCALRHNSRYLALLAGGLTLGVVVQAFYNMAYVIGLAPVTGIQLPLISSGGTSAVITLTALGLLASCARHEPEAIAAMEQSGRPRLDKILMIGYPQPLNDEPYIRKAEKATHTMSMVDKLADQMLPASTRGEGMTLDREAARGRRGSGARRDVSRGSRTVSPERARDRDRAAGRGADRLSARGTERGSAVTRGRVTTVGKNSAGTSSAPVRGRVPGSPQTSTTPRSPRPEMRRTPPVAPTPADYRRSTPAPRTRDTRGEGEDLSFRRHR